jgi:hypothetical protein
MSPAGAGVGNFALVQIDDVAGGDLRRAGFPALVRDPCGIAVVLGNFDKRIAPARDMPRSRPATPCVRIPEAEISPLKTEIGKGYRRDGCESESKAVGGCRLARSGDGHSCRAGRMRRSFRARPDGVGEKSAVRR